MLWAHLRFGHGSCHWLGAQEGYLLLGCDWAGCADLADEDADMATLEGADVAALGPLVNFFVSSIGTNKHDRWRRRENQPVIEKEPRQQFRATHWYQEGEEHAHKHKS